MRLVVGLGNPGAGYRATRHNLGFMVVDRLVDAKAGQWRDQFQGSTAEVTVGTQRVRVLKPLTFMNRSGDCVRNALSFFKIPVEEVLVIHDELDLPFGEVRLKVGGGEAGHNGLRSLTEQLGTPGYARLRCGVGRPPPEFQGDAADYVLQALPPGEAAQLDSLISRAVEALELTIEAGISQAMNQINRKTTP